MSDREPLPYHNTNNKSLIQWTQRWLNDRQTDRQMGEPVPGGMRLAVIRDQAEGARALQVTLCLSPSLATVLENPTRPILAVGKIVTELIQQRTSRLHHRYSTEGMVQ